ncbi:hypothetical protein [Micromonospora inositola]|uniref:hypothetical protein n=1 Tax=Micromonospora inositola TaxID=47865 RepID=UPI0018D53A4C|nr:hypothetical protein [Micromonospora inositola]
MSVTVQVEVPTGSPINAVHFVARNDTSHLAALVALVDAGAVRVDITASRPLTDLAAVTATPSPAAPAARSSSFH